MEVHRFLKNGDHKNKSQCCQLAQHPVDIAAMAAVMIVQVSTERGKLGNAQTRWSFAGRRHIMRPAALYNKLFVGNCCKKHDDNLLP